MTPKPELFHAIAETPSAHARALVVSLQLEPYVRFRNVHYPEVQADLSARGGSLSQLPAVWDGARLISGEAGVEAFLRALAASPPP